MTANDAKLLLIPPDDSRVPVVSIIVVSYNTCDMTLACLQSVMDQAKSITYEVIVIDNQSTDQSYPAIKEAFPEMRVMQSDSNIGFAAANNVAAQYARGEYLLLLNPDTVVLDHAVDALVSFAKRRPKAMIWGGKTLFGDGNLNPKNCYRKKSIWNLFCRGCGLAALFPGSSVFHSEGYGGWQRDSERRVDIVVGCFFLLKTTFWHELKGFDPEFFMYCEEADLCLRAAKAGAQPMVTPDAAIIHYGGQSETVREDKMVRLLASSTKLIRRHFPVVLSSIGIGLTLLWPWTRMVAYHVLSRVRKREEDIEQLGVWHSIWSRRGSWLS